jgi:heterotetrameric sarcosine oxidase delta subunit
MSFLISCPLCGPRDVIEFRYGGELSTRPQPGSTVAAWSEYLFDRRNVAGVERAWWFHRSGCRRWLQVERDTRTNEVSQTAWRLMTPASGPGDG